MKTVDVSGTILAEVNEWMKENQDLNDSELTVLWQKEWNPPRISPQDYLTLPAYFSCFDHYPYPAKRELDSRFGYYREPGLPLWVSS